MEYRTLSLNQLSVTIIGIKDQGKTRTKAKIMTLNIEVSLQVTVGSLSDIGQIV